jgi:type VI protein secretion system component VasK
MGGWHKYLELQVRAKTGLSTGLFVWAILAVVCGTVTFVFILVTAYVGLSARYGPLIAALTLSGFFLLVTIVALVCCLQARRRAIERAELALAARRQAPWLDPGLLGGAIQVGGAIGWRKVAPLLVLGVLAAGVGIYWSGRHKVDAEGAEQEDAEDNGRRGFARAA